MRSEKQIEASRRNGAKSRGPATPAGKRKSSANALRHGLLAKHLLLPNEAAGVFEAYLQQLIARMRPVDTAELALVEEMAINHWRLRRSIAIETRLSRNAMEQCAEGQTGAGPLAAAFQKLATDGQIGLLNVYENRIHRMFQRSLHNFLRFRAEIPPVFDPELINLGPVETQTRHDAPPPSEPIQDEPLSDEPLATEPFEDDGAQVPVNRKTEQTNPADVANTATCANRNPSATWQPSRALSLTTYALLSGPIRIHPRSPIRNPQARLCVRHGHR